MMEQNRNRVVLWATLLLITMLSLFSLHRSYQEKRTYLLEESQWMFQQAVHDDTGRRIEEMGDDYRFSFSGGAGLIKDTIRVQSEDTIIYIKNDIEAAKRASPKEKEDFALQFGLSMTNPMQVALLDSVFRASLHAREIPAQTGVCYTIMGKTTYSSADTSFCSSFTPLKEIVFGPRVIVLRAFARIPVSYIASEVFVSNILWESLLVVLWVTVIVLTWRRPKINILPPQEVPKEIVRITDAILFDETHGILHYQGNRIKLVNQRLRLFCVLLEHKEYFMDTHTLKERIWPDGSVSKDALITTAKRLKEDLALIPELTIESARGQGYKLRIGR